MQNVAAMASLTRNGWGVVATDYIGEGTLGAYPYLIGQGEGRSVLDSIRAAHQVDDLRLSDQTVVWGHSQGGHAALWAGQLAPTYAPELPIPGHCGAVAGERPSGPGLGVVATASRCSGRHPRRVSFVVTAYARSYPDITLDEIVEPSARTFVKEAAARCTRRPRDAGDHPHRGGPFPGPRVKVDPTQGPSRQRLTQNIPLGPWPSPLFIGQGDADEVVSPAIQARYVADSVPRDGRCSSPATRGHAHGRAGARVPADRRTFGVDPGPVRRPAGPEHLPLDPIRYPSA